jgi:hypothetical protein
MHLTSGYGLQLGRGCGRWAVMVAIVSVWSPEACDEVEPATLCLDVAGDGLNGGSFAALNLGHPSKGDARWPRRVDLSSRRACAPHRACVPSAVPSVPAAPLSFFSAAAALFRWRDPT